MHSLIIIFSRLQYGDDFQSEIRLILLTNSAHLSCDAFGCMHEGALFLSFHNMMKHLNECHRWQQFSRSASEQNK